MLCTERLFTKRSKCDFWLREVQILGHIISEHVIQMDPANIDAVMKWDRLKTLSKISSFLGLAGYYRRFIEIFSLIATTLTKLMRKNEKFIWTYVQH